MKRTFFAMMLCIVLAVTGCGGGDDSVVTEIISDANVDGDIMYDPATDSFTVTRVSDGFPSLLAGIEPVSFAEYRAFLDFPLGSVPPNASIRSATLDIVINSLDATTASVPMLIELVSLEEQLLVGDFNRSPRTNTTIVFPIAFTDVSSEDVIRHIIIDVTPLMREAQAGVFSNFQIRVSQVPDSALDRQGVIEIDETEEASPLLRVVYF